MGTRSEAILRDSYQWNRGRVEFGLSHIVFGVDKCLSLEMKRTQKE